MDDIKQITEEIVQISKDIKQSEKNIETVDEIKQISEEKAIEESELNNVLVKLADEWIRLDDKLKLWKKETKKLNDRKKELMAKILDHINNNDIIVTSENVKIKKIIKTGKKKPKLDDIEKKINDYSKSVDVTKQLMNSILETCEDTQSITLTRLKK